MNVIIIEDERLSAEHLANLLKKIDKNIKVIACFDTAKRASEELQKGLTADVLFMDIHLADGLSFEIFDKVKLEAPVIFTTAYDEYAIKAFKYHSIDYLLKPIGIEDLRASIDKYNRLNGGKAKTTLSELSEVYGNLHKSYKQRFMVRMGETIVSVKTDEVGHFIAEDGIVLLSTQGGKRYPVDYSLDQIEEFCDPKLFFRISRKVLLNINAIQKISTYFNSRLKVTVPALAEDDSVVSRERVNDFKLWLDK